MEIIKIHFFFFILTSISSFDTTSPVLSFSIVFLLSQYPQQPVSAASRESKTKRKQMNERTTSGSDRYDDDGKSKFQTNCATDYLRLCSLWRISECCHLSKVSNYQNQQSSTYLSKIYVQILLIYYIRILAIESILLCF